MIGGFGGGGTVLSLRYTEEALEGGARSSSPVFFRSRQMLRTSLRHKLHIRRAENLAVVSVNLAKKKEII